MGGTDENNFLNTIGKNKDGTGNGDILVWKRKAEKYLIEVRTHILLATHIRSFDICILILIVVVKHVLTNFSLFALSLYLNFLLLHVQSGLDYTIIHPGGLLDIPASQQQLVLDVDDKLLANEKRSISREDVANLCVAALEVGKDGESISFDCIATEVEEGTEIVPATTALQEFMAKGISTDYSL